MTELEVRVGITTGEVLVALDARVNEGEGMASGDVVNTAARLQANAPVNGILVDEATFWATRSSIDYEPAPPVAAKGKWEPVPAWSALRARSLFGLDVPAAQVSPLVGRERETAVVRDLLRRCRDESALQLLTLVGVPGIGKSRLLAELMAIVDADEELIWWRQGRSLPYGEGSSYWALGEVVKAQAGILNNDPLDVAATKLKTMVTDLVADDTAAWVEEHLRPLIGLSSEDSRGTDRRQEAFSAWRRLIEALAEERPAVLVFEDIHWADDGLLDFIDYLADWVVGVPVLLVCTARPELLDRRPSWGGGKRNATTMSVAPLSSQETARLRRGAARASAFAGGAPCESAARRPRETRSTPRSSSACSRIAVCSSGTRAAGDCGPTTSCRYPWASRARSRQDSTASATRRRSFCTPPRSSARCSGLRRSRG